MKVIPREARRITYSAKIRNLKTRLQFSDFQRAVVVGSILGDGHLEPNWSKTNYRLKVSHSQKQRKYILWKYGILKDWVLDGPRTYKRTASITFRSISHPELTNLWKIFYRNGKKIIPKNIRDFLKNPVTIAVWFMDDGNVIKRSGRVYGFHLNTQSFTREENARLAAVLKKLYGITALLESNHGKHRLRIMQKFSREAFVRAAQKYILGSMRYKFGE